MKFLWIFFKIVDRKIVHSWSVEANETLTCPVVHHDGSYYGIKDEVVSWLLNWYLEIHHTISEWSYFTSNSSCCLECQCNVLTW